MSRKHRTKPRREADDDAPEVPDAPDAEAQPENPLARAERERDEYKGHWQRAQADYQNLRRRQLADVESAARAARSSLLAELLIVLDYLDMALAAPVSGDEARNLRTGVEMTRQQFWHALERQDVEPIPTEGLFDPARHQAVATVETTEHPPGTVLEVVRKGYRMGDQVLRHAQVKVASAPPELLPGPETSAREDAEQGPGEGGPDDDAR